MTETATEPETAEPETTDVAPAPPPPSQATAEEIAQRAEQRVSREIVPLRAGESAITLQPGQRWWTDTQVKTLRAQWKDDDQPRDEDLMVYLHLCIATGLDPFLREIYYIGRSDSSSPSGKKWTAQTGIDGFRHIAERTGEYEGRIATEWCGADGDWRDVWIDAEHPPAAARVIVKRRGIDHPFYGIAAYSEFVPLKEKWDGPKGNRRKVMVDGKPVTEPMGLWPKMPAHMLAKCAEAQAIRAAFPRQAAGLYVTEEMHQADAREANLARAAARDAIAERSWARRSGVEIDPAQVVDTETVQIPARDRLLEELANQARIMGRTLTQWSTRWVAAHKKNVEEATDAELWDLATSRRDLVAGQAEKDGVVPFLADAGPEPDAETPDGGAEASQDGPTEPGAPESTPEPENGTESAASDEEPAVVVEDPPGQETLLDVAAPAAHAFYGGDDGESDACLESGCGQYADADVHQL